MVIIVENKKQEGVWSLPAIGREVSNAKMAIAEIDGLKKRLYSIFGDDSLFDDLDRAISKIKELAINAYAVNYTKKNYPKGSKPTATDVNIFATSLYTNARQQFKSIGIDNIDLRLFIQACLNAVKYN
jgi:hypothetical protein